MLKQSLICLIVAGGFSVTTVGQGTQESPAHYSIVGNVLDVEGHLVLEAKVHAQLVDRSGLESAVYSDWKGFTMKNLGRGVYRVYASKGSRGYTSVSRALFDLDPDAIPQVTLDERSPAKAVVIPLGPGAAKLVVRIVSAESAQPIENAQLVLRREDKPSYYHMTGLNPAEEKSKFKLLVPSLPLCFEASAPGYESWYYGGDGSKEQASALRLAPDEVKEMTIPLRPRKQLRPQKVYFDFEGNKVFSEAALREAVGGSTACSQGLAMRSQSSLISLCPSGPTR